MQEPSANVIPAPIAYRMPDASKVAGISKAKLYEEIAAGKLRSIKKAGRRLIMHDDLVSYLRSAA